MDKCIYHLHNHDIYSNAQVAYTIIEKQAYSSHGHIDLVK